MSTRLFAIVRAAIVATIFISIWVWFMPRWMASSKGAPLTPDWSAAALILMAIGGLIMLKCVWDFAWTGRGTPAPFDPPRRLVITGLYRYVRNPMYVGMGVFLVGEALFLPAVMNAMLLTVAPLWLVVTAFVMLYEEPTLREKFGEDYREYCRHVRRWLPRLTPFDKPSAAALPSPDLE